MSASSASAAAAAAAAASAAAAAAAAAATAAAEATRASNDDLRQERKHRIQLAAGCVTGPTLPDDALTREGIYSEDAR